MTEQFLKCSVERTCLTYVQLQSCVLLKCNCDVCMAFIYRDSERNKETAFLEAQIYEYVEILGVSRIIMFSVFSFNRVILTKSWFRDVKQDFLKNTFPLYSSITRNDMFKNHSF